MKKFVCLSASIILLLVGCAKTTTSSQPDSIVSSFSVSSQSSQIDSFFSSSLLTSDSNFKSNSEYKYEIVDNNVTIIEYIGDAEDVIMPDTIDGLPVEVIGANAFRENGLHSVVLPKQIQVIDDCAFLSTGLWEIFIPDSVIEIGENVFNDCTKSLILFYDKNPYVLKYAQENNLLCLKRSEYNPVLSVELIGGKPLNDDKNLGISKDDFNRIGRTPMNEIEFRMENGFYKENSFYSIVFDEYGVYNGCLRFIERDDHSKEAIQQKLLKTSTMLYQCGITEYNAQTIKKREVGCYDKLVTAAINFRSPEDIENDVLDGCNACFVNDEVLYLEAYCLFDFIPDDSLVTGYSEQQRGIWYYPKELPKVTTKVLSFSGNLKDGNYVTKIRFTDIAGATCEKTFSYSLVQYDSVGGSNYRVILKGIQ